MDNNQHMCKNHPDTLTVAQCSTCGDWFCADCVATANDKIYCKSHIQDEFSHQTAKSDAPEVSPYSRTIALLLCFSFGLVGLHLFYTGYVKRGVVNALCCVLGPLLLGWLLIGYIPPLVILILTARDFIQLASGTAKDAENRLICK